MKSPDCAAETWTTVISCGQKIHCIVGNGSLQISSHSFLLFWNGTTNFSSGKSSKTALQQMHTFIEEHFLNTNRRHMTLRWRHMNPCVVFLQCRWQFSLFFLNERRQWDAWLKSCMRCLGKREGREGKRLTTAFHEQRILIGTQTKKQHFRVRELLPRQTCKYRLCSRHIYGTDSCYLAFNHLQQKVRPVPCSR